MTEQEQWEAKKREIALLIPQSCMLCCSPEYNCAGSRPCKYQVDISDRILALKGIEIRAEDQIYLRNPFKADQPEKHAGFSWARLLCTQGNWVKVLPKPEKSGSSVDTEKHAQTIEERQLPACGCHPSERLYRTVEEEKHLNEMRSKVGLVDSYPAKDCGNLCEKANLDRDACAKCDLPRDGGKAG